MKTFYASSTDDLIFALEKQSKRKVSNTHTQVKRTHVMN